MAKLPSLAKTLERRLAGLASARQDLVTPEMAGGYGMAMHGS